MFTQSCITSIIGNGIRQTSSGNCRALPYASDFWGFARAGQRLAEIHVGYENVPEYEGGNDESSLRLVANEEVPFSWRVEKMRLSKDKTQIVYNDSLTIDGIPAKVFEYRLGHRSALEWVIDQYRVKTDKRSGIVNDSNRTDDPRYIVKLIRKDHCCEPRNSVAIVEGVAGARSCKKFHLTCRRRHCRNNAQRWS